MDDVIMGLLAAVGDDVAAGDCCTGANRWDWKSSKLMSFTERKLTEEFREQRTGMNEEIGAPPYGRKR